MRGVEPVVLLLGAAQHMKLDEAGQAIEKMALNIEKGIVSESHRGRGTDAPGKLPVRESEIRISRRDR